MTEITLIAYSKENQAIYFCLDAELFNRKKIYGSRKILALDKNGELCSNAQLSSSGTEIFPSGGTGFIKLNSDGTIYENKKEDVQELFEKEQHSFVLGKQNYSIKKIETDFQMNEFYEQEIEKLYVLKGINAEKFAVFLSEDFYEVHLNSFRKGYVFCRDKEIFLEVSKDNFNYEKHSEYLKQENLDFVSDSDFDLDDIDFEMI